MLAGIGAGEHEQPVSLLHSLTLPTIPARFVSALELFRRIRNHRSDRCEPVVSILTVAVDQSSEGIVWGKSKYLRSALDILFV